MASAMSLFFPLILSISVPNPTYKRKITRLTTMYKIVNGQIAINIPEYIVGPTRVTRSYHSSKYRHQRKMEF